VNASISHGDKENHFEKTYRIVWNGGIFSSCSADIKTPLATCISETFFKSKKQNKTVDWWWLILEKCWNNQFESEIHNRFARVESAASALYNCTPAFILLGRRRRGIKRKDRRLHKRTTDDDRSIIKKKISFFLLTVYI
jgi:hypothetical protein